MMGNLTMLNWFVRSVVPLFTSNTFQTSCHRCPPYHFLCLFYFDRPEKEIILNIAGNNRLRKVQRLTGEDFWLLSKVLRNRSLIIGTFA